MNIENIKIKAVKNTVTHFTSIKAFTLKSLIANIKEYN